MGQSQQEGNNVFRKWWKLECSRKTKCSTQAIIIDQPIVVAFARRRLTVIFQSWWRRRELTRKKTFCLCRLEAANRTPTEWFLLSIPVSIHTEIRLAGLRIILNVNTWMCGWIIFYMRDLRSAVRKESLKNSLLTWTGFWWPDVCELSNGDELYSRFCGFSG